MVSGMRYRVYSTHKKAATIIPQVLKRALK